MSVFDKLKADVEKLGDKASPEAKAYVANHGEAVNKSAQDFKGLQAAGRVER